MIVCTFYTDNFYRDFARRLGESLFQVGGGRIKFHAQERPSLGNHNANVHQKPQFVRQMMEKWAEPILWVDADAVVEQPIDKLTALDAIGTEIAYPIYQPTGRSVPELLGGTLYFGVGRSVLSLLDRWEARCFAEPEEFDQRILARVLEEDPQLAQMRLVLPIEYCWLESPMRNYYPRATPLIRHHGVSRAALRKGV